MVASGVEKFLTSTSMANIQDAAKWQFCKNTQSPDLVALDIIFSATGPCPCPSDIALILNELHDHMITAMVPLPISIVSFLSKPEEVTHGIRTS